MEGDNELWNNYLNGKGDFFKSNEQWFEFPIGRTQYIPKDPNLMLDGYDNDYYIDAEGIAVGVLYNQFWYPYLKN